MLELGALERRQLGVELIWINGRRDRPEPSAPKPQKHLLMRGEDPARLLVGVGGDDSDARHHVRMFERFSRDRCRLEPRAEDLQRRQQLCGREV